MKYDNAILTSSVPHEDYPSRSENSNAPPASLAQSDGQSEPLRSVILKISQIATVLILISTCLLDSRAQSERSLVWRPAVYRGLVVGKSSAEEVRKTLGRPEKAVPGAGSRPPLKYYTVKEPLPGSLAVLITAGRLKLLMLNLKEPISQKEAIRIFGSDFRIGRYSLDTCLDSGGEAPSYEDPDGDIQVLEYRNRGIALDLYEGQVDTISYLDGPFGSAHPRCAQSPKSQKKP